MSDKNKKFGKNFKYISRDLYQFSLDPIRRAICSQEGKNLNIYPKENIKISTINEKKLDDKIIGQVSVHADEEILKSIMQSYSKTDNISLLQGLTINSDVVFLDTNFSLKKHYEELKEIPTLGIDNIGDKFKLKVDFNYNKFIKKYEDFINKNANLQEVNLPNFDELVIKSLHQEFGKVDITDDLFEKPQDLISLTNIRNELKTIIYDSYIDESTFGLSQYYRKIDDFYNFYYGKKSAFPYYVNLNFDSYEKDIVNYSSYFNDIGDGKSIFKTVLQYISNPENIKKKKLIFKQETNPDPLALEIDEISIDNNFKNYLENIHGYLTTFFDKINSVSFAKSKSFEDLLKGEDSYCEVIGYKITKYDVTQQNISLIKQEYYLPNVFDTVVDWYDTQIKYNRRYKYKISAIALTFTYDYRYTDIIKIDDSVKISYEMIPKAKIYTIDSNEYANIMASYTYPPTTPEVEFIPYVGVDNKIKININSTLRKDKFKPISILERDNIRINEILDAQKEENFNADDRERIIYSTELPIKSFQIFKLNEKPLNYLDFSSYLVKNLETNGQASIAFEDKISPNKKYYYVIRTVDFHDNFSNPTEIFEIELINDAGSIYPLINVIKIDNIADFKDMTKPFRRFLKIQPSLGQRLANTVTETQVGLGINKESVWNKEFKIRITSKQTGKKIDLNVNFAYDVTTGKNVIKP